MSETNLNPSNFEGLSVVGPTTWDEVIAAWKSDEDTDSFRREFAEQGYESWEAWRDIIINPLHLDSLNWVQYDIPDPSETVPGFRGGPYKPWQDRYYGGKVNPTFAEIVATEGTDVGTRDKFADIIDSNKDIQLIGLVMDNDIYIIEGMHRSTSIALAARREQKLDVSVRLLLAQSDLSEFETIG